MQGHPALPQSVAEELRALTQLGFPIVAMNLVAYLKNMIQVACMGKLGSLELAGGALALSFTNITGYSILSGLAMGMDALCSQAFGSQNPALASRTLRRTILILVLVSLPIALLWLRLEPIMLTLHQNPDITRIASLYCRASTPDLVANSFLHPLRIYLRSRGTAWPIMWCALLAVCIYLPVTIFFAFTLSWGVFGIAVSSIATNSATVLFLAIYMHFKGFRDFNIEKTESLLSTTTNTHSSSVAAEWWMLMCLAVPSCLSVCLEWWWYEFMMLLAGYLRNPRVALATSAIVIQTTSLLYTIPISLSATVSTRIGNELGSGWPITARRAAFVAIGTSAFLSVVGFVWTLVGNESWARVFTTDEDVLKLAKSVLPIIGVCELANWPQTTSCGVLRGCARPGIGAGIIFYSFYLVGAPVAIILGFIFRWEFAGICYGLLAAQVACAVSILSVVYKTDWEKESLKAKELVRRKNNNHNGL